MNSFEAKKLFLKLFIGFLSLTALIAIVSVLAGDFGEMQLKTLATTFSISAASICSMSCAAFIEKRKIKELGIVGIALSELAASMVCFGIWIEFNGKEFWKTTTSFIVFAVATAHTLLLLLPDLKRGYTWTQYASTICILILSLQITFAFWAEIDDRVYYRVLTIISIIVVLFTLVIPILMKIGPGSQEEIVDKIVLTQNQDGTFTDKDGSLYRLEEIKKPNQTFENNVLYQRAISG